MPYGYYELLRLIAVVGFCVLAYQAYQQKWKMELVINMGLAISFQPFFKIALGRILWNFIDVLVAIWLLISIFMKTKVEAKNSIDKHEIWRKNLD
jgi:hypothetical protein